MKFSSLGNRIRRSMSISRSRPRSHNPYGHPLREIELPIKEEPEAEDPDAWADEARTALNLYDVCTSSGWLDFSQCVDPSKLGVAIQDDGEHYSCEPSCLHPKTMAAVKHLGAAVTFTMSSEITAAVFRRMPSTITEFVIEPRKIPLAVIDTMADLSRASPRLKLGSACLVKSEKLVLVWSDNVQKVIRHASDVERLLLESLWGQNIWEKMPGFQKRANRLSLIMGRHWITADMKHHQS